MEYITTAKDKSRSMPIYISKQIEIPKKQSGYFAIIFFEDEDICIQEEKNDVEQTKNFPSPGILCIAPNHNIKKASFSFENKEVCNKNVFTLIFKPNGINSTFTDFPETFEYNALTRIKNGYNFATINSTVANKLHLLFSDIFLELNEIQSSFWPCLTRSYILEVLLIIGRMEYRDFETTIFSIPQSDQKTQEIFQYIHNYYQNEITLDFLTEKFSTNRTTLNKIFNQTCGTSVISYLNKIRLDIATLLLKDTELSVATISERAGFSDESYFSRLFRKKIGMTPSNYRKSIPNPYSQN